MNPVKHVAIIMDGNGRWGIKHKGSRNAGHKAGLKSVEEVIKVSIKCKIQYLTLYTFSTENWKRPKKEITFLFNLLKQFLTKKTNELNKNEIRLNILGQTTQFKKDLQKILKKTEKITFKNKRLHINLALNYGSKNEILNAVKLISKDKKKFTEKNIENYLYTKNMPDPDLVIRTGNTKRLSNFLLWQSSYSEIYFEKKLWPDFNGHDFKKIINNFKSLKRNFGDV